jgi:hypothetical protein
MFRTVVLSALFLLAGWSSVAVDAILYRLALIAIVLLLHTLWIRAIVRRTRNNVINEIDHRCHARANRKANLSVSGQYQGEPPPHYESLPK